jgi:hypothetical protein
MFMFFSSEAVFTERFCSPSALRIFGVEPKIHKKPNGGRKSEVKTAEEG